MLLLDSLNTPKQDQVYVNQQIANYLKNVQPGTRIAIFTLGTKLRFIQGFSDDPSLLRAALNDKKYGAQPDTTPASRTLQDDVDDKREIWIKEQMIGGRDAGIDATEQAQASFATYQSDQRVSMTLEALRRLALYLAGVPGRKNLIWFSSNFPVTVLPSAKEKQLASVQRDYLKAVRATADLLTLSKVAIYPVGAEGVSEDHPGEAINDIVDAGVGAVYLKNIKEGSDTRAANIEAMEQLASDTGGEAIFNTNDLNKAIERAVNDGSHYYTLVYTPTNKKMDGKYRRIEVKLDQGKYKLAYRRGYYADEEATASEPNSGADPLRPLLARGMPSSTQLLYGGVCSPRRRSPQLTQPTPEETRSSPDLSSVTMSTSWSAGLMWICS